MDNTASLHHSSSFPITIPDPAFHAIICYADHNTKLVLSQTCSRYRAFFASLYAIDYNLNIKKGKRIATRVIQRDNIFSVMVVITLIMSVLWCCIGIYVAFFMFPPRTFTVPTSLLFPFSLSTFSYSISLQFSLNKQLGLIIYMVGLTLVIACVLALKHINHKTALFMRRVKSLGGYKLDSIQVAREEMPGWWRACMNPEDV